MPKSKVALGVQLNRDTARMVLIESGDGGLKVLSTQTVRMGEEMTRAFRSLPRRPSEVVCSVRLADAAIRILDLPPTVEENLERVVALEAETALPLQASELAIAHHVLGMTEQSRLEVLLAAARQSAVQDALQKVNCVPWVSASSTASAIALFNALQHQRGAERENVCAILRVEENWSELLVLDRNRIIVAQAIPMGCGENVPAGQPAMAVAVGGGGGGLAGVATDSLPWISALSQQVRYTLQAVSYERGFSIQRLYVCGEGLKREGVEWQLSERLDLPLSLLGPPHGTPHEAAPYAVAFGCALQGAGTASMPLKLALARVTVAREVEQRRQVRISWGALVGSVVLAGALVVGAMFHQQKQRLQQAEAKRSELRIDVPPPVMAPEELKKAKTAIQESVGTPIPAARVLSTLSRQLPEGTWLNELTYNPTTGCVIRGYSLESNGAQRAQIALLRQQLFDEVTLDYRTEDEVAKVPVWAFQLTCKIRPKEAVRRGTRR